MTKHVEQTGWKRAGAGWISMLLAASFLLSGCGKPRADPTQQIQQQPNTSTAAPETVADPYDDDLPSNLNYGGYPFKVLTASSTVYTDFDAENLTGERVKDALYKRNRKLEARFNIVFENEVSTYNENNSLLERNILSQSDEYDLIMVLDRQAFAAAEKNYILRVEELPYLDITKPYYAQDVNQELSISGVTYFAYSDECLNMFEQTGCVFFNKQKAEDLGLGDLYETVENGKWTHDLMHTYALTAARDVNNNGNWDSSDVFGIIGQMDMFYPSFWTSANLKTVAKDADDHAYFAANGNEHFINVVQNAISYFNQNDGFLYSSPGYDRMADVRAFSGSSSLFHVGIIGYASYLGDMEEDFGVLPFPKYDEAQEGYHSRVVGAWINVAPSVAPDPARTSAIMEALASESAKTVYSEYYESALKYRYLRDEQSIAMLELIKDTRTMDLGDTIFYSTVRGPLNDLFKVNAPGLVSYLSSYSHAVDKLLQTTNETADAIKSQILNQQ